MRHKRVWAAALALALFLTACGGGSPAPEETAEPTPTPDPAAALVGTWSNDDGVGLKFSSGGTVTLSGFGLNLGGDTFSYEVKDADTLTLTATVGGILSKDIDCPYGILDNTLVIDIGDYSFELTKQ